MSAKAQNIYDLRSSLNFAGYLVKSKQFDLAIHEYERINFSLDSSEAVRVLLFSTYLKAGKFEDAAQKVELIYTNMDTVPEKIGLIYSKFLLLNHTTGKANNFAKNNKNINNKERSYIYLNSALLENDYKLGSRIYTENTTIQESFHPEYKPVIDEALKIKYKSPALALGLSAIVPGTGKIYSGDWKDGLISMVIVGVSAYQAYRGFSKNGVHSNYGWLNAGIGFGFYLGNIYGSRKSAKQYNYKKQELIHNKIERIIRNSPF